MSKSPPIKQLLTRVYCRYHCPDTGTVYEGSLSIVPGVGIRITGSHGELVRTDASFRMEYLARRTNRRLWPITDEEFERAQLRPVDL